MERELCGLIGVFVLDVEQGLSGVKSSVVVLKLCLVEGLWLVETVTVGSSNLVGVLVCLGSPTRAVPVLSVLTVTTSDLVKGFFLEVGVCSESRLAHLSFEFEVGGVLEKSI
jgi:hypothetical protein